MAHDSVQALILAFQAAAFDATAWEGAITRLARATGSRMGQLIGLSGSEVLFNWIPDAPDDLVTEFAAMNGGDPEINPRVRAGIAAPTLQSMAEADFLTADDMVATPIYADLFARADVPFICLANLMRGPDGVVGLSVLRTARQGHIEADERAVFDAVAPHVQAAVRTRMRVADEGAALLNGALGSLAISAFVLDGVGRIKTMTAPAAALISEGARLGVRAGRLVAAAASDAQALDAALWSTRHGVQNGGQVILRGDGAAPPWVVEVSPLPRDGHGFAFAATTIVTVQRLGGARSGATEDLMRGLFGLTRAEARIASGLVGGASLVRIAGDNAIALATVRTHVRAILDKAGVGSQRELVSLIATLG